MTDFETWLIDVGYDRLFRMLIKRRVGDWTPYEWDKKFSDESQYEDTHYSFIKIVEAIELPNGNILIGYKEIFDADDLDYEKFDNLSIEYKKLSEIELSYSKEAEEEFYADQLKKEHYKFLKSEFYLDIIEEYHQKG